MEAADSWCQRLEEAQAAPTLPARIQRVLALSPAGFPLRDIASMVGYRGPRMDRLMGYLDALAVSMTRQCQQWDRSRREWVPGIKTLYKAK